MSTATLTHGQQMTLDTIAQFGATTTGELAEYILDCEPTYAEKRAAKEIAEQLIAAGLLALTDDVLDVTDSGRAAAKGA